MATMNEEINDFLSQKRIAVAGVSRENSAANIIYKKLRNSGYEVFPLNPNASQVEGDQCYANVEEIPGGIDGIVIATRPEVTEQLVRECSKTGVSRVWIHRSFGEGSYSSHAVEYCRENGIAVIPGGCPMMYCQPVDFGHKCMRWFLNLTGKNV